VDIPNPLAVGVDSPVLIVKVSQKYHLKSVVGQQLDHNVPQRECFTLSFLRRVVNYHFIDAKQSDVHVEKD